MRLRKTRPTAIAPKSWAQRTAPAPWTPDDDRELQQMVECGLSPDYYQVGLPHRYQGEILERRLMMIEAGVVARPQPL